MIPIGDEKRNQFHSTKSASNRYSIYDHGQGCRTYTYEFDLPEYEPEQITVLLDECGRLRIRAARTPCNDFRREYYLGGPNVETRLVRNTIDSYGRLRVDVDVRPRPDDIPASNNHILTFDLQGYRPKNVNVRLDEQGLLKISAQHSDDTFGNRINREYYRQYQLPRKTGPEQIRARMDENQILTIELPASLVKRKDSWVPYCEKSSSKAGACSCNVM